MKGGKELGKEGRGDQKMRATVSKEKKGFKQGRGVIG